MATSKWEEVACTELFAHYVFGTTHVDDRGEGAAAEGKLAFEGGPKSFPVDDVRSFPTLAPPRQPV